jgi:hypothetical protein
VKVRRVIICPERVRRCIRYPQPQRQLAEIT